MPHEARLPKKDSAEGRTLRCIWRVSLEVEAKRDIRSKTRWAQTPIFWQLLGGHSNNGKHTVISVPWLSLPYCGLWLRNLKSDVVSLPFIAFSDQCHSTIQFPATLGSYLVLESLDRVLPEGFSTCQCCLLLMSFEDTQTTGIEERLEEGEEEEEGNFSWGRMEIILKICSENFSYTCLWKSCLFPLLYNESIFPF